DRAALHPFPTRRSSDLCNPRLGRFDSGAAPSKAGRRIHCCDVVNRVDRYLLLLRGSSLDRRRVLLTRRSRRSRSYMRRPEMEVDMTTIESATEIRPFTVEVPEEDLVDLRRRIAATRWPERETVADESQGVQLATMQELIRYWGTEYDFRRFEARLNELPQFITEID